MSTSMREGLVWVRQPLNAMRGTSPSLSPRIRRGANPRRGGAKREMAAGLFPPPFDFDAKLRCLRVVVEREFVWMRTETDRAHFLAHLVVDPGLDQVLGEHVALEQELVILPVVLERRFERRRHARHFGELGRRQ